MHLLKMSLGQKLFNMECYLQTATAPRGDKESYFILEVIDVIILSYFMVTPSERFQILDGEQ